MTNYHAQKLIDELVKEVDLFAKKKQFVSRNFDDVLVTIEYFPTTILPNHVINIVRSEDENRCYLLDTRFHAIGDIINDDQIILNDLGLTNIAYVEQHPRYFSFYQTDYELGLRMLNSSNTNVDKDIINSIIYRESATSFLEEYKRFKIRNQERFNTVANNLQLVKKYL